MTDHFDKTEQQLNHRQTKYPKSHNNTAGRSLPATVVTIHPTITELIVLPRDRGEPTVLVSKPEAGYLFGVLSPTSIGCTPLSPVLDFI